MSMVAQGYNPSTWKIEDDYHEFEASSNYIVSLRSA